MLGRLFSLLTLTATYFSGQQKPRELTSFGGYQRSTWNYLCIDQALPLFLFCNFACHFNNLQLEIKVYKFPTRMYTSLQHIQFIAVQEVSYDKNLACCFQLFHLS